MDERMKGIEERWPFLFPLDRTKEELADGMVKANHDIFNLLQQIYELEHDLSLNASMLARQTDMAREAEIRVKELRTRVAELEEWCGSYKEI